MLKLVKSFIKKCLLQKMYDLIHKYNNFFQYNYLVTSLERLWNHPLSKRATDFIMKYRKALTHHSQEITVPPVSYI